MIWQVISVALIGDEDVFKFDVYNNQKNIIEAYGIFTKTVG